MSYTKSEFLGDCCRTGGQIRRLEGQEIVKSLSSMRQKITIQYNKRKAEYLEEKNKEIESVESRKSIWERIWVKITFQKKNVSLQENYSSFLMQDAIGWANNHKVHLIALCALGIYSRILGSIGVFGLGCYGLYKFLD